jgi:uncharacterized protein (DUF2252 family)
VTTPPRSRPRAKSTQARTTPARTPTQRAQRPTTTDPTAAAPSQRRGSARVYDAVWNVRAPSGDVWTARPWVTPDARASAGKNARQRVPRSAHATFEPAAGRDPIAILTAQEADRLPNLLPLRHARMAESAFAYYRGTPAVMAFDLAGTPRTDMIVQASGDAHISNFGLFASPERSLVFDANDFDETLPGPWEWDVKRLSASVVIAGRANGFSVAQNRAAAMSTVRSYREWLARYATMRLIDIWYAKITETDILAALETVLVGDRNVKNGREKALRMDRLRTVLTGARQRDQIRAFGKLTTIVQGRPVIVDDPPVAQHVEIPGGTPALEQIFSEYRQSMGENRRDFLERYRFVDFALKVVGVGSVGTRCFIVVLEGRDEQDPLILQAKQAEPSVLEPHLGVSRHANHGRRVVTGQRAMQATPDILLGWTTSKLGRHYYFRQLWDMKGSVETTLLRPDGLGFYGGLCGRSLARAHARTGDAVAISAYLGTNDAFDGAIADFAETYADVNERDYQAYRAAIASGRVSL